MNKEKNIMGMPINRSEVNADGSYEYTYLSFEPMASLIRERKIDDVKLARQIGEKVNTIRRIQLNQDEAPLGLIRKLCHALGCNPGDLMVAEKATYIPAKQKPEE